MKKIPCYLVALSTLLSACSKKEPSVVKNQPLAATSAATIVNQTQFRGSLVGFSVKIRQGGGPNPTSDGNILYNLPLFQSSAVENDWWENLVEEYDYSGLDFFAANCRGYLPNGPDVDHGDPRKLTQLVRAMDRRGVGNKYKIAVFDDCPTSWCASSNLDKGIGYTTSSKFDAGDPANYKYIWDYNIKVAFQNIPDEKRFKYDNRPVIIFWNAHQNWMTNFGNGNLKKILLHIRSKFQETFGVQPYLIIQKSWMDRDPTSLDVGAADAIHDWFNMEQPWRVRTHNGIKIGTGIPGFRVVKGTTNMFVDPRHGEQLTETLQNTVGAGAQITLIEGFTDVAENAALFRSSDNVFYDYPNQRLNILRRFSQNPYPASLKIEAEACDFYHDLSSGNSGNSYRQGNLDIVKCGDINKGWHVNNTQAGEWLEWKEIPFSANNSKFEIRYSSVVPITVVFSIDGIDLPPATLPVSGFGYWASADAGTVSFPTSGLHTVRLKIVSGNASINYFNRISL